jgi:hypothetical protein
MLIPIEEGKLNRHHHIAALGHATSAGHLLKPLLVNIRVGLASVADALADGKTDPCHGTSCIGSTRWRGGPQAFLARAISAAIATGFGKAVGGHRAGSARGALGQDGSPNDGQSFAAPYTSRRWMLSNTRLFFC